MSEDDTTTGWWRYEVTLAKLNLLRHLLIHNTTPQQAWDAIRTKYSAVFHTLLSKISRSNQKFKPIVAKLFDDQLTPTEFYNVAMEHMDLYKQKRTRGRPPKQSDVITALIPFQLPTTQPVDPAKCLRDFPITQEDLLVLRSSIQHTSLYSKLSKLFLASTTLPGAGWKSIQLPQGWTVSFQFLGNHRVIITQDNMPISTNTFITTPDDELRTETITTSTDTFYVVFDDKDKYCCAKLIVNAINTQYCLDFHTYMDFARKMPSNVNVNQFLHSVFSLRDQQQQEDIESLEEEIKLALQSPAKKCADVAPALTFPQRYNCWIIYQKHYYLSAIFAQHFLQSLGLNCSHIHERSVMKLQSNIDLLVYISKNKLSSLREGIVYLQLPADCLWNVANDLMKNIPHVHQLLSRRVKKI